MKIGNQTLIVTNEHGSWAVLFVPMVTGIVSTKLISAEIIPLFFLVLFSFMLYKPAEILYHEWQSGRRKSQKYQSALASFLVYGIFAAGFFVYEFLFLQKYLLLGFATGTFLVFILSVQKSIRSISFPALTHLCGAGWRSCVLLINENTSPFQRLEMDRPSGACARPLRRIKEARTRRYSCVRQGNG